MIGETVGNYRIVRELGRGGMGVVYAAEHVRLGSNAAVKLLLPRYSSDRAVVARFFNEARAASRIEHPGIVRVFDYGDHASGSAFLVMEMLQGETLAARRRRLGRLPVRTALVLARQVAGALAAAHAAGIVHRDLKPGNLFLVPDPEVDGGERMKVLDFGIAKLMGELDGGAVRTGEDSIIGTPRYMAPEQCKGAAWVDHRADVYALGCIVYELITGDVPFSGDGHGEVIAKQIYESPPPPSARVRGLEPGIETLVMSCLAKAPAERPESMAAVATRLDQLADAAPFEPLPPALPPHRTFEPRGATLTSVGGGPPPVTAAPATPVPATLGSSSAQVVGASRAPGWRLGRWPLVAVALVGGVAAAWLAPRPATPTVAPDAASAPLSLTATDAGNETTVVGPDAGPRAGEAVLLTITSEPPGAAVFRAADDVWLGQTPLSLRTVAVDGRVDFVLRLRGHKDARVTLRADVDDRAHVALLRDAASRVRQGRPAAPPTPASSSAPGNGVLDPLQAPEAGMHPDLDPF